MASEMNRSWSFAGLALSLALLGCGCGGDDDGGDINVVADAGVRPDGGGPVDQCSIAACGGDPTGTWTLAEVCFPTGDPSGGCPGVTIDASGLEYSGTFTFEDGGELEVLTSTMGQVEIFYPTACIGGLSCEELSNPEGLACQVAEGGCACTDTLDESGTSSGTWSVEGSRLTTRTGEGDDLEIGSGPFCVDGDTLDLGIDDPESGLFSFQLTR